MAKSDEEYDLEPCNSLRKLHNSLETLISDQKINNDNYRYMKHHQQQQQQAQQHTNQHQQQQLPWVYRHYSMTNISPPAPPSTPTSLMATCSTPMPSPPFCSSVLTEEVEERLNNSEENLHELNLNHPPMSFNPRYMKMVKDQQNTDTELAKLFDYVSLAPTETQSGGESNCSTSFRNNIDFNKLHPERGVSSSSRTIRKLNSNTKSLKFHRSNPKEFYREPDEDSVSAPEYDSQEEYVFFRRRFTRFKHSKRYLQSRRHRRLARFEHQERMEDIVDNFGATMKFNDI